VSECTEGEADHLLLV